MKDNAEKSYPLKNTPKKQKKQGKNKKNVRRGTPGRVAGSYRRGKMPIIQNNGWNRRRHKAAAGKNRHFTGKKAAGRNAFGR
jgi:hypothetical protein